MFLLECQLARGDGSGPLEKKGGKNALGERRELLLNSVFVCRMLTLQNGLTD